MGDRRATCEAVALYDQTSFSKLLPRVRDALAALQRLCANEIDLAVDKMVCTALLNERGVFASDLTIIRPGQERSLIITGSAQTTRDIDWIDRHIAPAGLSFLTDVGAMLSVPSMIGLKRELIARKSPTTFCRGR